jgi:hypothetical protein
MEERAADDAKAFFIPASGWNMLNLFVVRENADFVSNNETNKCT